MLGGFPVPQGTGKSHENKDAESSLQDILRSELWGNGNDWDVMHGCVVFHPLQEGASGAITDRFGEVTVT